MQHFQIFTPFSDQGGVRAFQRDDVLQTIRLTLTHEIPELAQDRSSWPAKLANMVGNFTRTAGQTIVVKIMLLTRVGARDPGQFQRNSVRTGSRLPLLVW